MKARWYHMLNWKEMSRTYNMLPSDLKSTIDEDLAPTIDEPTIQYSGSLTQYIAKFDPVKIMSIRGIVERKDGKFYTEPTAIRHIIDYHHFTITRNPCQIHFQSTNNADWKFDYNKMITCEDFYNFVAEIVTSCKSAVSLLFTIHLLGILKMKCVV